jgi:hypothetical protein
VLVTDVFLGRVSEANLVQAHEPWLRVFGVGTFIVADKVIWGTFCCRCCCCRRRPRRRR